MSSNDRPKPPRPPPPSEPTIRSRAPSDPSVRAAGLTRPQSSPEVRAELNRELELNQKFSDLEAKTDAESRATARHVRKLEDAMRENDEAQNASLVILARELGVAEKLPARVRGSVPPPAATTKPPKPRMPRIEGDASQAKVAALVAAVVAVLEGAWRLYQMINGGK